MGRLRDVLALLFAAASLPVAAADGTSAARHPLDPVGRIHIPIGIANTVDTLKTFVEAEGPFSPGCGSYGVYFWLFDPESRVLAAPTDGRPCVRGLPADGALVPWVRWKEGELQVVTRVGETRCASPAGEVYVVGAVAEVSNLGARDRKCSLYVALRPTGPAGFAVKAMSVSGERDALMVEGHPAIVCDERPDAIGVAETDAVGLLAMEGRMADQDAAKSERGDCSGAVRHDLSVKAGQTVRLGFVCPVLPGRRAVGHDWDGRSPWAQLDLNAPNPASGGLAQPDPGLAYYRDLEAERLVADAAAYWRSAIGKAKVSLPDPRWAQCLGAILGHAAMAMNEGAPDVAVINFNVFNRDGVYVANILQKSGNLDLSGKAIDYFLARPFNGRTQVEADNPGQVLWILGQQWLFSRDKKWLERVYPSAAKLAAMVRYYRTQPPPHYVKAGSLEFGETLAPDPPEARPADRRQTLAPGSCDGFHPEYTEAFDIAGLRAAALMAEALGRDGDRRAWNALAAELMALYDRKFGAKLPAGYGSYCVFWPCALHSFREGQGHDQFKNLGAQKPAGWRYFPLATAHQALLAGNRQAGHGTLELHLAHEQCQGWYSFDEGGDSGSGGWRFYRTTWKHSVAMPHGWAVAELWLLLRDCLLHEDGQTLVLLGGVAPDWFQSEQGMAVQDLPTCFGPCSFRYVLRGRKATMTLSGGAWPPRGHVLRMPKFLVAGASAEGKPIEVAASGDIAIPIGVKEVQIDLVSR